MVATIGEKIVETSLFGDQNNPLALPSSSFKVGVFLSLEVALKA